MNAPYSLQREKFALARHLPQIMQKRVIHRCRYTQSLSRLLNFSVNADDSVLVLDAPIGAEGSTAEVPGTFGSGRFLLAVIVRLRPSPLLSLESVCVPRSTNSGLNVTDRGAAPAYVSSAQQIHLRLARALLRPPPLPPTPKVRHRPIADLHEVKRELAGHGALHRYPSYSSTSLGTLLSPSRDLMTRRSILSPDFLDRPVTPSSHGGAPSCRQNVMQGRFSRTSTLPRRTTYPAESIYSVSKKSGNTQIISQLNYYWKILRSPL